MAGKILVLDIEWRPTLAYVWRPWKENISDAQIVAHGGLSCCGLQWIGEKTVKVFSDWENGHQGMVEGIHAMLSEADAVVTYNGDRYDLPKLNGEFLLAGLNPTPPIPSIDLIKTVRKLGFFMNGLGFIGPFLGVGEKVVHEGMGLWVKVENGDAKAQALMAKYCAQDVRMTTNLYHKVLPFIKNHPGVMRDEAGNPTACGTCGSDHLQKRGPRYTKYFKIQRLQCQGCGQWFDGERKRI